MGAFDRIKSGLPGMDRLLDSIRMGDNVVWSVSNLEEFTFFALPFAEQAVRDGRNIIYMRFAKHEPLLLPMEGVMVMERDREAEDALRRMGKWREVWFVTCQRLLENETFTGFMQRILKTLEEVYRNPVDIEYTVNLDEHGSFVLNLVQCRPLYAGRQGESIRIPSLPKDRSFFRLQDSSMGSSASIPITAVVQIDPVAYYHYPYASKPRAAEAVGRINRYFRGSGANLLLMAPGRLGTSSPELGVPVSFAHISGFRGICEISDRRAGYMPELSYGSHMFQDLVEADIFYCAIWNDARILYYNEKLFEKLENLFPVICPEMEDLFPMFHVCLTPGLNYWNDALTGNTLCCYPEDAAQSGDITPSQAG